MFSAVDWFSAEWWEPVLEIWREFALPESETVRELYCAAVGEGRHKVEMEYERLFVGPASLPCPPYESMWRTNRPRHEQGMITGENTAMVRRLYADFGFNIKQDCHEFADHVAIEFEALASAMELASEKVKAEEVVIELAREHLGEWMPSFCAAVMNQTHLEFYRLLAALTTKLTSLWSSNSLFADIDASK